MKRLEWDFLVKMQYFLASQINQLINLFLQKSSFCFEYVGYKKGEILERHFVLGLIGTVLACKNKNKYHFQKVGIS